MKTVAVEAKVKHPVRSSKSSPRVKPGKSGRARAAGGSAGRPAGKMTPVMSPSPDIASLLQTDDPVKQALVTRVVRMLANTLRNATPASLQQAIEAPTDAGSAAHLLSMAASLDAAVRELDPMAAAIVRGVAMKRDLLEQAGGVLETARVAELLGISRQGVAKRVRSGALLAIPDASGHLQFPAMQFTDAGTVDGFEKVLAAFNVESPWTRLSVLLDTDEAVGGRRIIDALRAGELDAVLDVVRSFGA